MKLVKGLKELGRLMGVIMIWRVQYVKGYYLKEN